MKKFDNYLTTAKGEKRAFVDLNKLTTLWLNTGTLCNITCGNCYIESSPKNDALVYMTYQEVKTFLDEVHDEKMGTTEIGITGGEPFMNPDIMLIIEECLSRQFKLVVLTNAMRPMMRHKDQLLEINKKYHENLILRVSVDHFNPKMHDEERGIGTWDIALNGLSWLSNNNFSINIAGRTRWGEELQELRQGYSELFKAQNINVDADDPMQLILFPEMDEAAAVPEITTECWDILDVKPEEIMCSNSRMVVKRKGATKPAVIACTLLPYSEEFEFASTLKESSKRTYLNHQFCSKFCVLGGGSCTTNAD
jgi:sulfatase maturation enzyme AslB (radical SAM superfamily)